MEIPSFSPPNSSSKFFNPTLSPVPPERESVQGWSKNPNTYHASSEVEAEQDTEVIKHELILYANRVRPAQVAMTGRLSYFKKSSIL